ncbi:MAG: TetR/AcrR family transcriptional regulator [Thermoleophilaceae bacterium]
MKVTARQPEATRAALVAAARELFAERGYAGVGTEEIVGRAGVTRGALYHHFTDKEDLMRAVLHDLNRELAETSATAALKETDQWRQILAAVNAFLDACTDPAIQRIVMTDAPSVLGWEEWREIDTQYGLGLIKASLEQAMETGLIARQPVDPLAHLLVGALDEAAMYISRAPDTGVARREMGQSIERMFEGLRV